MRHRHRYHNQELERSLRQVVFLSAPALRRQGHGPNHQLKTKRLQPRSVLLDENGTGDDKATRLGRVAGDNRKWRLKVGLPG
jgi:hypothetical protein